MNDFYKEIQWRGILHSSTPGVEEHLRKNQRTGYIGFDPTASSLHVGSLLPIMALSRLQAFGHPLGYQLHVLGIELNFHSRCLFLTFYR